MVVVIEVDDQLYLYPSDTTWASLIFSQLLRIIKFGVVLSKKGFLSRTSIVSLMDHMLEMLYLLKNKIVGRDIMQ